MFCPECGAENEENSKFCKKCGKKLIQTKKGLFTSKWSYVLIIVLIIFCSIGFYVWISWAENHDFNFQEPNSNWTIDNEDHGYSLNNYCLLGSDTPNIYVGALDQQDSLNKELDVASDYTDNNFTSIENGTIFVDNSKAYYFIYEFNTGNDLYLFSDFNTTLKSERVVFEKNDKLYLIRFTALPQDFDALHGDFMTVVNSFKVKNTLF